MNSTKEPRKERTFDANDSRTRLPAAMAAGVTESLMSFEELFDRVMGNAA